MDQTFEFFVGVDWATAEHQVCVLDAQGKQLGERAFKHSGDGLAECCAWLIKLGKHERHMAVAIEVPHGAVVETLLERGFAVHSINPKQLDRFRDRFTTAGAKDDSLDAKVLADSLRTDGQCFRKLQVEPEQIIELREWSRMVDDLQRERTRLVNRQREQLRRYFPAFLELADDPGAESAMQLWELMPTPQAAADAARTAVADILKKNRISRFTTDHVLTVLRQTPVRVADGTTPAATAHIGLLIKRVRLVNDQIKACRKQLESLVERMAKDGLPGQGREQRDVAIIQSMSGIGVIVLAVLLAEAAQLLRERDYPGLRAFAGVAPVTRRSGKKLVVIMRYACNYRLRHAVYHWARVATQTDELARCRYAALRARGKTHGHALRCVADRLLGVLCAMLRDQTEYRVPQTSAA